MTARNTIHATGLVLGKTGVLLRGPSGAGKSLLALELLDLWALRGEVAYLVSDDRLELAVEKTGLVMQAPAAVAGLIELRGRGIVKRPFIAKAPLHLVVDLIDEFVRMVEEDELMTDLLGHPVARCPVPKNGLVDARHQLLLIGEALREAGAVKSPIRQKIT
jgi:HPr kinase/phosphorylase